MHVHHWTHNLHANTQLNKQWPSTWIWASEWLQFKALISWQRKENQRYRARAMKSGAWDNDRSQGARVRMEKQALQHRITLNSKEWSGVSWYFNAPTTIIQYTSHHNDTALRLFLSLTDLAVAEMYWTTISRLVLKSFPRRGCFRSSFRFMSSYTHTHTARDLMHDNGRN